MKLAKLLITCLLVLTAQTSFAKTAILKAEAASEKQTAAYGAVTGNNIPVITWGADITAFLLQGKETLLQNNILTQISDVKSGKTPFFRGTMGQAIYASDAICEKGDYCLEWLYKYSDSTGGDGIAVKSDIATFADLCGKKVGLQLGGPHMDFASTLNTMANCSAGNEINYVFFKDLGLDSKTKESAVNALFSGEIDAAFGITVDLKSDEAKAAKIKILSTTASFRNSITDHLWVRADYAKAHPDEITKLASTLLQANEKVAAMAKANNPEWQSLKAKGAKILFEMPDDPNFITAVGDMYLYDLTMAGWTGNYKFATCDGGNGKKEAVCFDTLVAEISNSFQKMGLLKNPKRAQSISTYKHKWDDLKVGLTENFGVVAQTSDHNQVVNAVAKMATSGTLDQGFVSITALFDANDNEVHAENYTAEFEKATQAMVKAGGSIKTLTAHADSSKYLLAKYGTSILPANFPKATKDKLQAEFGTNGVDEKVWKDIFQAAQDSSQKRATAMLDALEKFVDTKGINLTFENVEAQGMGVKSPVNGICTYTYQGAKVQDPCFPSSSEIMKQNRRVVFTAHNMDSEITIEEKF